MTRPNPASAPWWPLGAPKHSAHARLVCFPHAGGGASLYVPWRKAAAPRLDVCPVQLPGREGRIREPAFRKLPALVDALMDFLPGDPPAPYALFGYSMGALIAFELTRKLAAAGRPLPRVLFVAASAAPQRRKHEHPLHRLPDAEFRRALRELEGTPNAVLEHDELMELMLPMLRADFELSETYVHAPGEPLDVPIVAFGGERDPGVPAADLEAWAVVTRAGFRSVLYPAGHFFLAAHAAEVLAEITAELEPPHGSRPLG